MLSRIAIPIAVAGMLFGFRDAARSETTRQRPNIVIMLADDLGYADVGFHVCRDIPTLPHRMASGNALAT